MNDSYTELCLVLHSIPGISILKMTALLRHFGSPAALMSADRSSRIAAGMTAGEAGALELAGRRNGHPAASWSVDQSQRAMQAVSAGVMAVSQPAYPALLRTIHDPPPLLYYRGDRASLRKPCLAIVGSRKASPAGLRMAAELSAAATDAGLTVVSGLALGIDASAHRRALSPGGSTVAVMATGIEQVYPRRHNKLAVEIADTGCLLTEFPPGSAPLRGHFPQRNRLISGLSLATVVIEAALPSGSLLTAGTALEQGREVFAAPWSIFHRNGRGCLRLIRDGAGIVESIDDVLLELDSLYQLQLELDGVARPDNDTGLPPAQAVVLAAIGDSAVDLDSLVASSHLPVAAVLAGLSSLELQGKIARLPAGYVRC
ncbi:MAG: DNA-processing protein DprA [Halieaceae bacterium]